MIKKQEDKSATTIEEQIGKLEERGMEIGDLQKAQENLLDIGYFRLGFYWFPFENTYPRKTIRDHTFKEGTKLSYAIKLYYFDFDLRNLFLRYISRIEINFRTKLIYYASNEYKDDPFWYVNTKCVKKEFVESDRYKKAIYDANCEPVVKQDLLKYKRKYAPAWKVLESMTFGAVISLYENLIDGRLKHDISKALGIESSVQFSNYLNTIRRLRNHCAHGKVLFDISLPAAICNGPAGNLGNRKTMLSGAYYVLKYMLGNVSENRQDDLVKDVKDAYNRIQLPIVEQVICDNSGFIIAEL